MKPSSCGGSILYVDVFDKDWIRHWMKTELIFLFLKQSFVLFKPMSAAASLWLKPDPRSGVKETLDSKDESDPDNHPHHHHLWLPLWLWLSWTAWLTGRQVSVTWRRDSRCITKCHLHRIHWYAVVISLKSSHLSKKKLFCGMICMCVCFYKCIVRLIHTVISIKT